MTKRVMTLLITMALGNGNPTTTIRQSNRTQGRIIMLVLGRKVGEKLIIDGNIQVEVMKIQGNRISLGIVAPSEIRILRGELKAPVPSDGVVLHVEDGLLTSC